MESAPSCFSFVSVTSLAIEELELCQRIYSRFSCPCTTGVDAFQHDWSIENSGINSLFRLIGRVSDRRLRSLGASSSLVIPFWVSAPWWHMVAPNANHLDTSVVDWLWLPRWDTLFSPRDPVQGRETPSSPRWQVLIVRLCFSGKGKIILSPFKRCLLGGCGTCRDRQ